MKMKNKNSMLFITIDPIEYRRRVLDQISIAQESGYEVSVISIGEKRKKYKEHESSFHEDRILVWFRSGPLKFLLFNLKLLWRILWCHYDTIHLRGLWVLPAVMIRRIFRNSQLIYDAHEYFAGLEIFKRRPLRKYIWLLVEKLSIPHIHTLITVSEPLGDLFQQRYPRLKSIMILKNMPSVNDIQPFNSDKFNSANYRFTMIFHGYFLKGRALTQTIRALAPLKDTKLNFILMGDGPLKLELENLVEQNNLHDVVSFQPFVERDKLLPILSTADIGLSLIEDDCINRKYSLPNKFFELISAGIPVLASNIITQQMYVDKYNLGLTVDPQKIEAITEAILFMSQNKHQRMIWTQNCLAAAKNDLNWEKESEKLKQCYTALREKG
jgi:glycosyltransferase involved in cell wall biosynthesis